MRRVLFDTDIVSSWHDNAPAWTPGIEAALRELGKHGGELGLFVSAVTFQELLFHAYTQGREETTDAWLRGTFTPLAFDHEAGKRAAEMQFHTGRPLKAKPKSVDRSNLTTWSATARFLARRFATRSMSSSPRTALSTPVASGSPDRSCLFARAACSSGEATPTRTEARHPSVFARLGRPFRTSRDVGSVKSSPAPESSSATASATSVRTVTLTLPPSIFCRSFTSIPEASASASCVRPRPARNSATRLPMLNSTSPTSTPRTFGARCARNTGVYSGVCLGTSRVRLWVFTERM